MRTVHICSPLLRTADEYVCVATYVVVRAGASPSVCLSVCVPMYVILAMSLQANPLTSSARSGSSMKFTLQGLHKTKSVFACLCAVL